jgi:hypothetical protein
MPTEIAFRPETISSGCDVADSGFGVAWKLICINASRRR